VNIRKVCGYEVLSFISERSGEILLFSYQQKCRRAQSYARCVQDGGSLRTYQPRGRLKDHCCKECTRSKTQITRI
jgi:hypothetical protein